MVSKDGEKKWYLGPKKKYCFFGNYFLSLVLIRTEKRDDGAAYASYMGVLQFFFHKFLSYWCFFVLKTRFSNFFV